MNKIICNVCGTSYPENATQCPICGYVQTAETALTNDNTTSTYTYVKGGRFSKANVKKRNQSVLQQCHPKSPRDSVCSRLEHGTPLLFVPLLQDPLRQPAGIFPILLILHDLPKLFIGISAVHPLQFFLIGLVIRTIELHLSAGFADINIHIQPALHTGKHLRLCQHKKILRKF